MIRPSGRTPNQLRPVKIVRHYTKYAEGSVLISYGDTQVICNVSVTEGVPRFLKGNNQGWLTAEYSLLPRSTHTRSDREAVRGHQSGRTQEIQRLIGRSLRTMIDMKRLGEYTIVVDCDVLQADGGTRTAAITGSCVALVDALNKLAARQMIAPVEKILKHKIAAVSVGVYQNQPVLDLDYNEDAKAATDMNVVMNDQGQFVEIQGTAEHAPFSPQELNALLELAQVGCKELMAIQTMALATTSD